MAEDYFWLIIGSLTFIVGILSFFRPELFITKDTPKYSYLFRIETRKYLKIRAVIMIIGGFFVVTRSILNIVYGM